MDGESFPSGAFTRKKHQAFLGATTTKLSGGRCVAVRWSALLGYDVDGDGNTHEGLLVSSSDISSLPRVLRDGRKQHFLCPSPKSLSPLPFWEKVLQEEEENPGCGVAFQWADLNQSGFVSS